MKTNEELLRALYIFYVEKGTPPTRHDFPSTTYKRRFGSWSAAIVLSGIPKKKEKEIIFHPCPVCKTLTTNSKYCSKKCTSIFTANKRRKSKILKEKIDILELSIGEYCGNHGTHERHAKLREIARKVYKKNSGEMKCKICGYSTHIEICHIKPLSKFSKCDKIKEVNAFENLVALCPNHHWEFDHDLIKLQEDA